MIKALFITENSGEALQPCNQVQVVAGAGIVGDRNFKKEQWPGQNITFVASEAIEKFNNDYQQSISLDTLRRNIVTEGVNLNALVGKKFSVGEVRLIGVELCEPCKDLGLRLENEKLSGADIVKAFLHSGGLRADILSDGVLSVGMPVVVDE